MRHWELRELLRDGGALREGGRRESDVRVTTAFNRLLRLPGASVIDLSLDTKG